MASAPLTSTTSSGAMPYPGSSSEWKIPITPARIFALWAISAPRRSLPSGLLITPSNPGRATPSTFPPLDSAPATTLDLDSLNLAVRSTMSAWMGATFFECSIPCTSSSDLCRSTSLCTYSGSMRSSWTPLTSTLAPPGMEMFRSSRMVPRPLLTILVALSREPSLAATSFTSSGVCMSGPVATSIRGIPNRSSL